MALKEKPTHYSSIFFKESLGEVQSFLYSSNNQSDIITAIL